MHNKLSPPVPLLLDIISIDVGNPTVLILPSVPVVVVFDQLP